MEGKLLQTQSLKDVATAFYYSRNPEQAALELIATEEYKTLKVVDQRFLDVHINEALLRFYLTRLSYCVSQDPSSSIKQIADAQMPLN